MSQFVERLNLNRMFNILNIQFLFTKFYINQLNHFLVIKDNLSQFCFLIITTIVDKEHNKQTVFNLLFFYLRTSFELTLLLLC